MADFVDIHTHAHDRAGKGIRIISRRLGIEGVPPKPYSEGIHPWDVDGIKDAGQLLDALRTDDIVAVGETGLDRLHPSFGRQEDIFREQLAIARERGLPVIIHCVKAFEEVMKILSECRPGAVIFHGYTGSAQQTSRIKGSGYYISLGKVSLESHRTVEGLAGFPPDRIFLETDDSGIGIGTIFARAADLLGIPPEELKERVYMNYKTVFGL